MATPSPLGATNTRGTTRLARSHAMSSWSLVIGATVAVVGVLILIRAWASLVDHPSSLGLQGSETGVVTSVVPGSREWLIGIRSGDSFFAWPHGGIQVLTISGADVGVPDTWPSEPLPELLFALVLHVAAIASWRLLPGLARVFLVGAASVVVANLLGVIVGPAALAVMLVPALVMVPLVRSSGRWVMLLVAATIGCSAAVTLIAAVAPEQFRWAETWRVAWMVPLVVAAMVVTIEGSLAIRRARAGGVGRSSIATLVASTSVGRQAIRAAVEEERDRQARVLHQQVLPPITASLAALDAGLVATPATMLRSLASDLRQDLEQEQLLVLRTGGLEPTLMSAAAHLESVGLACSVDVRAADGRPPWEVEIAAWRIAQEALTNALRHSSASSVDMVVSVSPSAISIDVTDDGVGMQRPTGSVPGHLGLLDMRERAREVGGRVDVLPARPTGLRVSFRWPG